MDWMNDQQFLTFIDELADCNWFEGPKRNHMKQSVFWDLSYKHWAMQELRDFCYRAIERNPNRLHTDIVQDFADLMDQYACQSKKSETSYIFSIAYDMAMFVLDMLLGGEFKNRRGGSK